MIAAEKETPAGGPGCLAIVETECPDDYKVTRRFAAAYAALRWPVFPLKPGSKTPATAHGFKNATTDPAEIERFPDNANLGIATGSAFWVLDIDGPEGRASLEMLEAQHGELPQTLTQITRNGGKHLVFAAAPGIRSRAHILPGLDVRGHGGYVTAEPSRVDADDPAGPGRYSWLDWEPTTGEVPEIAEAPRWLLDLVRGDQQTAPAAPATRSGIAEGNRNDHLSKRAYALRKAGAEAAEILTALRRINSTECQPPLDEAELIAIAKGKSGIQPDQIELTERKSYKLRSAAEIAALPPVRWLVKGVLPAEGMAALFGASGSGKTFLALDAAAAIAEGRRWFGRRTNAAPVVYLGLEGEGGLSQRVQAWERHHGRPLPEGLRFVTGQPFNLPTAEDVSELAQAFRAVAAGDGLTIIDTLNRASSGLDENSSQDMGRIIEAASDLQRRIGGLVLLVHHSGKDALRGLRGHSSLHAALDAAIEVKRDGDARSWSLAKSKDGADAEGTAFRLEIVELGEDGDGEAVTSCVVIEEGEQADNAPAKDYIAELNMRNLLRLTAEVMATGDVISTSRAAAGSNAWGMLRDLPDFPAGLDRRQTLEIFREMNARGLLERCEYVKPNRHTAERWELTSKGYEFAGIAPPAPACVSNRKTSLARQCKMRRLCASTPTPLGVVVAQTQRWRRGGWLLMVNFAPASMLAQIWRPHEPSTRSRPDHQRHRSHARPACCRSSDLCRVRSAPAARRGRCCRAIPDSAQWRRAVHRLLLLPCVFVGR